MVGKQILHRSFAYLGSIPRNNTVSEESNSTMHTEPFLKWKAKARRSVTAAYAASMVIGPRGSSGSVAVGCSSASQHVDCYGAPEVYWRVNRNWLCTERL